MSLGLLQLSLVASALFFGIGHTIIAIGMASIPSQTDQAIEYIEWLMKPINYLFGVSFLSLLSAAGFLWVYSGIENCAEWYVASGIVTILGLLVFFTSKTVLKRAMLARLRGDS